MNLLTLPIVDEIFGDPEVRTQLAHPHRQQVLHRERCAVQGSGSLRGAVGRERGIVERPALEAIEDPTGGQVAGAPGHLAHAREQAMAADRRPHPRIGRVGFPGRRRRRHRR